VYSKLEKDMNKDKIGIITADIIESTEINFELRNALFSKFNEGLDIIKKNILSNTNGIEVTLFK